MELAADIALLVLFMGAIIMFGVLTLSQRWSAPQHLARAGLVAGLSLYALYGDGQTMRFVVACALAVIIVDMMRAVSREAPELGRQVVIFMVPALIAPVSIAVVGRGSLGEHVWVVLASFLWSCLGTSVAVYVKVSRRLIAANLAANALILVGAFVDLRLTGELPGTALFTGMLIWALIVMLSVREYARRMATAANQA